VSDFPPGLPAEPTVIVLPEGASSIPDLLTKGPRVHAVLTHDAGLSWPDAAGCQLARAAIQGGGAVILQFVNFDDAELCRKRLEQSRAGAR
jgi:hypothetical protein